MRTMCAVVTGLLALASSLAAQDKPMPTEAEKQATAAIIAQAVLLATIITTSPFGPGSLRGRTSPS